MTESFVGESITPVKESAKLVSALPGEPCLPMAFQWNGRTIATIAVIEKWKEAGDCHHGSGERYVRKHWYRVRADDGSELKLYCERQPRGQRSSRWRLFTIQAHPERP